MSEPSLAAAFAELKAEVGNFLGFGRGTDYGEVEWTEQQTKDIDQCVRNGQRMVYNCGYDWSFLKPALRLTLAEGATTVPLPDDFSQLDGPVQVVAEGGGVGYEVPVGPWQPIYAGEARTPDRTGPPCHLAVEPLSGTGPTRGQRFQLHAFPTADQAYTLTARYRVNVNATSGLLPYTYGGAQYSQLLLQACSAAAERDLDRIAEADGRAVHQQSFRRMLEEAKAMDRRAKPHTVGPMIDRSDRRRGRRGWIGRPLLPILVDGILYD